MAYFYNKNSLKIYEQNQINEYSSNRIMFYSLKFNKIIEKKRNFEWSWRLNSPPETGPFAGRFNQNTFPIEFPLKPSD